MKHQGIRSSMRLCGWQKRRPGKHLQRQAAVGGIFQCLAQLQIPGPCQWMAVGEPDACGQAVCRGRSSTAHQSAGKRRTHVVGYFHNFISLLVSSGLCPSHFCGRRRQSSALPPRLSRYFFLSRLLPPWPEARATGRAQCKAQRRSEMPGGFAQHDPPRPSG